MAGIRVVARGDALVAPAITRRFIDLTLTPDGHFPGTHVHPSQEERFEVVKGTMKFKLGFETIVAHAGDVVVVPGRRHPAPADRLRRRSPAGDRPGDAARNDRCMKLRSWRIELPTHT